MSKARMLISLAAMLGALALAGRGAQEGKVYKAFKDDLTPSSLLTKVEPGDSEEAREAKLSGTVVLSIVVRSDGRAHGIEIN